jgi:hypothetical protein
MTDLIARLAPNGNVVSGDFTRNDFLNFRVGLAETQVELIRATPGCVSPISSHPRYKFHSSGTAESPNRSGA